MPYIKPEDRKRLEAGEDPQNPGELNYLITVMLLKYLKQKGKNYAHLNEVMGVLNCVTHEFYRRWAGPYEDEKIKENGDVI